MLGVHKNTLLNWLYQGKISEPERRSNGGQDIRLWSDVDVERAKQFRKQNYWRAVKAKKKTKPK